MEIGRSFALDDIEIQRGGDGRTVEAYAAVFGVPQEIRDDHGHYVEVIDRSAFNRTLSHGIARVGVLYNHGLTSYGTPSDLGSVPIGQPVSIEPDGRGLRTVSRLNKSALADSVLEAVRAGDIRGFSFRGRVFRSTPDRIPRPRGGELPTVTRTELGLREYGPTPTPAYEGAGVLAVRSTIQLVNDLAGLDGDRRAELLRLLSATPDGDPADETATPTLGLGAEDSPEGRSGRLAIHRARLCAELTRRGVRRG